MALTRCEAADFNGSPAIDWRAGHPDFRIGVAANAAYSQSARACSVRVAGSDGQGLHVSTCSGLGLECSVEAGTALLVSETAPIEIAFDVPVTACGVFVFCHSQAGIGYDVAFGVRTADGRWHSLATSGTTGHAWPGPMTPGYGTGVPGKPVAAFSGVRADGADRIAAIRVAPDSASVAGDRFGVGMLYVIP